MAEQTIMDMVVESMGTAQWHPFTVFWVENGAPEYCSLPDLSPSVVTFNTRYLDLLAQARLAVGRGDTLTVEACEQVGLQTGAELALRYGNPELGCYLFMRSQMSPVMVSSSVQDLEFLELDEAYMPIWFYALLHEVGHIVSWHPVAAEFTSDFLEALVDNVFSVSLAEPALSKMRAQYTGGEIPSLGVAVLLREIIADLFAVDVLLRSTQHMMRENDTITDFSPVKLATSILDEFQLFRYLNKCASTVRYFSTDAKPDPDPMRSFAHTVRLNVLIHYLAEYVINRHWRYGGGEQDATRMREGLRMYVRDSPANALNAAFREIEKEFNLMAQRKDNVLADLKAHLDRDANGIFFQIASQSFIGLAETLKVNHPDLDSLRLLTGPNS
jgi:hypothetical protein